MAISSSHVHSLRKQLFLFINLSVYIRFYLVVLVPPTLNLVTIGRTSYQKLHIGYLLVELLGYTELEVQETAIPVTREKRKTLLTGNLILVYEMAKENQ